MKIISRLTPLTSNGFLRTTTPRIGLSIALLLTAQSVLAFKPNSSLPEKCPPIDKAEETDKAKCDYYYGTHAGIVKQAIEGYCYQGSLPDVCPSISEIKISEIKFSSNAVKEIQKASANVDILEFFKAEAHCDAEKLCECSRRIAVKGNESKCKTTKGPSFSLIDELVGELKVGNGDKARKLLGRALHTLQDFYAHSNWVDLDNIPSADLIVGGLQNPHQDTKFCQNSPPDKNEGTLLDNPEKKITSGYFPPSWYFTPVVPRSWWYPGNTKDSGKCGHGLETSKIPPSIYRPGIAKDTAEIDTSDFFASYDGKKVPYHPEARKLAVIATNEYINKVLDRIKVEFEAEKFADAIRAFMGTQTRNLVIDRDSRMIKSLRTRVRRVADTEKLAQYAYTAVGKQTASETHITSNADDFKRAIDAIESTSDRRQRDGKKADNCSKPIMQGLYNAIAAQLTPAPIFLFTDAAAADAELANLVIAEARANNQSIYVIVTDKCSPEMKADSVLLKVTKETGGQLFQVSQSGEELMGSTGIDNNFMIPLISEAYEHLFIVQGELTDSPKDYSIPVDSTVSHLIFSVSMAGEGTSEILRPSGEEVTATDHDVTVTELANGQIIHISEPARGEWKLQVTGHSRFSASVLGRTEIKLSDFQFVEMRGRPLHQGLFPIHGQPMANAKSIVTADVSGSLSSAELELRSETGNFLQTLRALTSEGEYSSELNGLPVENFRVYLKGTDTGGFEFLRVLPALWLGKGTQAKDSNLRATYPSAEQGNHVRIMLEATIDSDRELIVGQSFDVYFRITNTGSNEESFQFITTNNREGIQSSVTPVSAVIKPNQSVVVTVTSDVTLEVPDDNELVGTSVNFTLLAESTTTPKNHNKFDFETVIEKDSDGDGVSDRMEGGSDLSYDGNNDGIADYDQANVVSLRTFDYWEYVTLETSEGSLHNVLAVDPDSLDTSEKLLFPLGLFSFTIKGVTTGGTAKVKMFTDWPMTPDKKDDNPKYDWYAFDGDTTTTFNEDKVEVTFIDGAKGDADLSANGVIKVQGGTGIIIPDGKRHSLSGYFYYDDSDNPIAGVMVQIGDQTVESDEDGYWEINGLAEGNYRAFASYKGYTVWTEFVVGRPLLDVKVVSEPSIVQPGEKVTYTITVTNNNSETAEDVILTDLLPEETTLDSITLDGASCDADTVKCSLPYLTLGTTATATVVVDVNNNVQTAKKLVNTVTVTADKYQDAVQETSTTVQPLSVSINDIPDPVVVTDNALRYTVTIKLDDSASQNATGVRLEMELPNKVEQPKIQTTDGTCNTGPSPTVVNCDINDLSVGSQVIVYVDVTLLENGGLLPLTFKATVTANEYPEAKIEESTERVAETVPLADIIFVIDTVNSELADIENVLAFIKFLNEQFGPSEAPIIRLVEFSQNNVWLATQEELELSTLPGAVENLDTSESDTCSVTSGSASAAFASVDALTLAANHIKDDGVIMFLIGVPPSAYTGLEQRLDNLLDNIVLYKDVELLTIFTGDCFNNSSGVPK